MDPLFLVLHDPPETGKVKVVGVYSSEALAEAAIERTRVLPGFLERPNSFRILRYGLDEDHWSRGFISL